MENNSLIAYLIPRQRYRKSPFRKLTSMFTKCLTSIFANYVSSPCPSHPFFFFFCAFVREAHRKSIRISVFFPFLFHIYIFFLTLYNILILQSHTENRISSIISHFFPSNKVNIVWYTLHTRKYTFIEINCNQGVV